MSASNDKGPQNQIVDSPPKYDHLAENWGPIFCRKTHVIPGMNHNLCNPWSNHHANGHHSQSVGCLENRNRRMTLDLFSWDDVDSPARKQPTLEHFRLPIISWGCLFELIVCCNSCQATPQSQAHVNDSVRCGSVGWCKLWQPRWDTRSKDLCEVKKFKDTFEIHIVTECHDMSLVITILIRSYYIYIYICRYRLSFLLYIKYHNILMDTDQYYCVTSKNDSL